MAVKDKKEISFEREASIGFLRSASLSRLPFDARIAAIAEIENFLFQTRKDRWQRNDRWQTEQDSFHFDATIAGHKFVRSLRHQRSLRSNGNQA